MKWSFCHSVTYACASAALSLVYLQAVAHGVSAKATVASASPEAQISLLRQQMSALEARVHELEKHADDVKLAGLQLFDGADSEGARVSLYGTPNPTLTMTSTGKKQQTTLGGSNDGSFGLTLSGGGTPAGFLGTKADGRGYLELNDSSGLKMVEAGSLDQHKGYVLTTPYHASVTLGGDPSVLLGGSGR